MIVAFRFIIIKPFMMNSRVSEFQGQSNQGASDRPELSSTQILQVIRKRPFTQNIHGVEYTYSILNKKQQTFVLTNQRFLVLKGIESISYAREFPPNRTLPFANAAQLPQFKFSFPISEIENFTNEQEKLIIQFSGKNKVKWEFVCPTKVCALQWRKKLDNATHILSDFHQSGFNKYEEYVQNKKKMQAQKFSQFSQVKSLMGSVVNYSEPSLYNLSQATSRPNQLQDSRAQAINTPNSIQQTPTINNPLITQTNPTNQQANINQSPVINQTHTIHQSPPISKQNPSISNQQLFGNLNQAPVQVQSPQKAVEIASLPESKQKENNILAELIKPSLSPVSQQANVDNNQDINLKAFIKKAMSQSNPDEKKKVDRPTAVLFRGSQMDKVENFIIQTNNESDLLNRSMMSIPNFEKQIMKGEIAKLKRDWIEELIIGEEEVQLIIDFKNYAQKIAEVIINELYVAQEHRIYPAHFCSQQYATYLIDDLEIQIYFYNEEHLILKNPKYKAAVRQFKNFDYLLGLLNNVTILKVPLMILFQYKGFLGMAKSRIGDNLKIRNKELFELIDRKQFEAKTRISASVLLNQAHCKIVAYEKRSLIPNLTGSDRQTFFVEKLTQFLPSEQIEKGHLLLRPQFVQDEELEEDVFRDQACQVKNERINGLIGRKINHLVKVLESGEDYFTNSKELSEIIHFYGLNVRHIGAIFNTAKQGWLKKLIQAEIVSRCAKNFFRLDIQNSVLTSAEKLNKKQRQEERERHRVISFLNILFGNTETTFRLWRGLNDAAQQSYGIKIWQKQFFNINIAYLLQAIQNNFKIILANTIHEKSPFKSMNTFQPADFIRFQFDSTIYDLEFADIFDEIHECLEEDTFDSFHDLCQILIEETSTHVPYLQLLKNHPIHDKISEFLLTFTSPDENQELYKRIQSQNLPSRFAYESKLAEIKWYLKLGDHQSIRKPFAFIEHHAKKWLGNVHPIFTQLNRILAEYFSQQQKFYGKAIEYAQASLEMQLSLFEGDCQLLWKDYFLIAKIHYSNGRPDEALKFLAKAKQLVRVQNLSDLEAFAELCLMLTRCYVGMKQFKLAYSVAKQLYSRIRQERDERSLNYILESVTLIKQLLQFNQEHESYYRFIESDFSQIISSFAQFPNLINPAIKMIAIPYLKNVILKNSHNRGKILLIIDQISKTPQSYLSCLGYLKAKIVEGLFPKVYLHCLKDIDSVIEEIEKNGMVERWINFNKLANQSLLEKISNSQVYRGFEFLANLTALFHLLGEDAHRELFIMEK